MINESNTSRTQVHQKLTKEASLAKSRRARQRLKWMEHFKKYRNARLTCRHFGISPDTFYSWKKRFNPENLQTLEDNPKTRKPKNFRKSKHTQIHGVTIKTLKEMDTRLGKIRIAKILKETGHKVSPSTITRILRLTTHTKET